MKKLKGGLTICVTSTFDGEFITINIQDKTSGLLVTELEISHEEFSKALTGLGNRPCDANYNYNENIGKKIEVKTITFKLNEHNYGNMKEVAYKCAIKECPSGWSVRDYFDSSDSFFMKDGESWAKCIIKRYV